MAFDIEKTHYFTLADGTNITVSQLPDAIKDQVKIFDEIRENIVLKSFEAQVYQLAGEQKRLQLQKMLESYMDAKKMADSADTSANEKNSPEKTKNIKDTKDQA